eukprot:scaffold22680_cov107-Cylindrotheca_fusiformis.AAC.9
MSNAGVTIAGIYDSTAFWWGGMIFNFAVERLEQEEAYSDLNFVLVDSACDETTAVRAYWDLRTQNNGIPVHGIVGARCSGASVSLARIAGLEEVNQVSPSATSSRLTDKEEFPFFSRLVAPDDATGEVGALVASLQWFGWDRVSILSTDTLYAKDYVNEFRSLWETEAVGGEIAYSNIVRLNPNGELNMDSVDQALNQIPTGDPASNSRIVLLIAQNQHAYPILKRASETGFQPDTVWVGTSSWVGREPPSGYDPSTWLGNGQHPGYLGLGPVRHENRLAFLDDFNNWFNTKVESDKKLLYFQEQELPIFAAELVDSVTALVKALYAVPVDSRRDGELVREQLWNSDFEGVSGRVRFTSSGDRRDPRYSIFHYRHGANGDEPWKWATVGESGIDTASTTVELNQMCFATFGCSLLSPPLDSYPVPTVPLPSWVIAIIVILLLLFLAVSVRYWRSRRSKQNMKKALETFKGQVIGMRTAEKLYIPSTGEGSGKRKKALTSPGLGVQWCWRESGVNMHLHDDEMIVNHVECWVKYSGEANTALESAFQAQAGKGTFAPLPGYVVDFPSMIQTKTVTGFKRDVQRLEKSSPIVLFDDETSVTTGDTLPEDIRREPQMVLVPGDVIQISKETPDSKWAFGTKLFHQDEEKARLIVEDFSESTGSTGADSDEANILADTGWFHLGATRAPTTEDLASLKQNVGDTDALNAPSNWTYKDSSNAEVVQLSKNDPEWIKVKRAFESSIRSKVAISSISRVENLPMWQSYVVKRQTICNREIGQPSKDDGEMARAMQRYERSWLWHGTNSEVMDKILQQGFNRSFCGKNATAYGKGVYFARDSSYSAYPIYAVPDSKGYQYIMACRVVVGEFCRGVSNALTPDVRNHKTHTLYDSTVDSMGNPSIYVTYHDAQAYPEVSGTSMEQTSLVYRLTTKVSSLVLSHLTVLDQISQELNGSTLTGG